MNQYSKAQEDRMEQKLKEIGFILLDDTARRSKGRGDRLMEHKDTGLVLCVDHKSTIGKESIRLDRKWFDKIKKEAGDALGCITFSYKGCHKIYIAFDIEELEGVMY